MRLRMVQVQPHQADRIQGLDDALLCAAAGRDGCVLCAPVVCCDDGRLIRDVPHKQAAHQVAVLLHGAHLPGVDHVASV